jgi:hypothetical protein
VDVEEAQEGLGPAVAVIGRAHPHRLPCPAQPADRAEFERAHSSKQTIAECGGQVA